LSGITSTPDATNRDRRYRRLNRFNLVIGLVHLAQAVVLVVLSNDLSLAAVRTASSSTAPIFPTPTAPASTRCR
jgi:hypothetical protein